MLEEAGAEREPETKRSAAVPLHLQVYNIRRKETAEVPEVAEVSRRKAMSSRELLWLGPRKDVYREETCNEGGVFDGSQVVCGADRLDVDGVVVGVWAGAGGGSDGEGRASFI
jgi:hypothetical protein